MVKPIKHLKATILFAGVGQIIIAWLAYLTI